MTHVVKSELITHHTGPKFAPDPRPVILPLLNFAFITIAPAPHLNPFTMIRSLLAAAILAVLAISTQVRFYLHIVGFYWGMREKKVGFL
jgi:hypothetical protein